MSVLAVRKLFDLTSRVRAWPRPAPTALKQLAPAPGRIVCLTGPSGGGKSRLLHLLARRETGAWVEPAQIVLPDQPVIDCVSLRIHPDDPDAALEQSLELLSRVGLAEAWTYLQRPRHLSDGQRWRLRLAMALTPTASSQPASAGTIIAVDEFGALLDRVTAAVVARALRRLVDRSDQPRLGAVVATAHDDLIQALDPDVQAVCDFGELTIRPRIRSTRPTSSA